MSTKQAGGPIGSTARTYGVGQTIGAPLRIPGALVGDRAGVIKSLLVNDLGNQKSGISFLFFNSEPRGVAADGSQFMLSPLDVANLSAKVDVAPSDYVAFGGPVAIAAVSPSAVVSGNESGDVWVVAVANGGPIFSVPNALSIQVGFLAD